MSETTEKKRGNPSFGKQNTAQTGKWDTKTRYHFKMVEVFDSAKPRDAKSGEMLDNPYPPIYIIPNSGSAIHPTRNEIENWRYVFGYSSIWVKDQEKPVPSKQQLENPKNFIEFKNGSLFVMGNNTALLDALAIQDIFEGVESPVTEVPKIYLLVNEDKTRQIVRKAADVAYEAEKAARECSLEEMIPVASAFGINVDDFEENEDRIRDEFILKAKAMPEQFKRQFVNPKNKFKYNITMALRQGFISTDVFPGKMTLVDTKKAYFDVKEGDVAEQFATLLMQNDSDAHKLYDQLEKVMVAAE